MFARTASGVMLPVYIVFKSEHLYSSWTYNAPKTHDSIDQKVDGLIWHYLKIGILKLYYLTLIV